MATLRDRPNFIRAQQAGGPAGVAPQVAASSPQVIKAESNLVLVDVIATDKKGKYIEDLDVKEFQVFEDKKPQIIASFSPAGEAPGPKGPTQPRYIVLFFDDSTMTTQDQMLARRAANQFVEKTASPNRLMAVVDFGGTIDIVQNFTSDGEKLKRATADVRYAAVSPNISSQPVEIASIGAPTSSLLAADFGARTLLLAIRGLAKSLRTVPGRKTLILFSEGFPLTTERQSELNATIDAANKANVAIYPLDVRGLAAPVLSPTTTGVPRASLLDSQFPHEPGLLACLAGLPEPWPQRGGGGGGGTGGGGGGGSRGGGGGSGGGTGGGGTGGRGGSGGTGGTGGTGGRGGGTAGRGGGSTGSSNPGMYGNSYMNNLACSGQNLGLGNTPCPTRQIIPPFANDIAANQQVLYALAAGTGGFPIFNTNDFLAGLDKIARDIGEYYILGYVPPSSEHDGSYHQIEVKLSRAGVQLRHRNGYYDLKSPDLLVGKPEGKTLEEQAAGAQPGEIPILLSTPYFYSSPGVARVNVALQIPASAINFEKDKSEFHSKVQVLGIAYREDGSVAARFSDAVKLDMAKKDLKQFSKGPYDYQNIFSIAPGKYTLRVALSAGGDKFAKYETPLTIATYDGNHLEISGPALSDDARPVNQLIASLDSQLLEDQTPLLFRDTEIIPKAGNHFQRGDKAAFYVEVFEPLLQSSFSPRVGVLFKIVDRKTNQQVYASNTILLDAFIHLGNPLVPLAQPIPLDQLQPGEYRLEVQARNDRGEATSLHDADFVLE
jgi:VWFA-related protein